METSITFSVGPTRHPTRSSRDFPNFRNCFVINFEFNYMELYSRYMTTINIIKGIHFEILCNYSNEYLSNILYNMFDFVPHHILCEIISDIEECATQMMANNFEGRDILEMDVLLHVSDEEIEYINQNHEIQAQQIVDLMDKLRSEKFFSDSTRVCSICLEEFCPKSEHVSTKCSHVFHEKCMVSWIQQCIERSLTYSCPLCRCQIP